MIHSYTSFGKLREVIVGRELDLDRRVMDMTFKYFYKEALGKVIYDSPLDGYKVSYDLVVRRNTQLDGLASVLESFGVKVHRPKKVDKVVRFQTPTFKSETSSASNVRDITLVYGNAIVETPTYIRNRYFENRALYEIFSGCWDMGRGGRWIKAPLTDLTEKTMDLEDWRIKRDFSKVDPRFEMAVDAAQFMRIGKDVICNVSTYNHFIGFQWMKSLFPESDFHMVQMTDNHIDGAVVCLKPGVFLCDPIYGGNVRDQMPEKFKSWKFIYPENLPPNKDVTGMTDADIRLASSRGMDINVLSVDENTVIASEQAVGVIKALEENGFTVCPVRLENGEIFGGGIHCSTLDLVRDGDFLDYG